MFVNAITLSQYVVLGYGLWCAEQGRVYEALATTLVAPILDLMDGTAARKLGVTSQFGGSLDLVTDVSCITVLSSLIWRNCGIIGLPEAMIMWGCSALRHAFLMTNMDSYKCWIPIPGTWRSVPINTGLTNTFIPYITLGMWWLRPNPVLINFITVLQSIGMVWPLLRLCEKESPIINRGVHIAFAMWWMPTYALVDTDSRLLMAAFGTVFGLIECCCIGVGGTGFVAIGWVLPMAAGLVYDPGGFQTCIKICWGSDILQYCGGKLCSVCLRESNVFRTTPFPTISKNKTVGGYLFGISSSVWMLSILSHPGIGSSDIASIIILGMLGDLILSWVKRLARIKDFGSVFGSHGGVLDKIDSIAFAYGVGSLVGVI